jgi:hypothetical protein
MEAITSMPRGTADHPQCMKALARANRIRITRAAMKRTIAAGAAEPGQVVIDCSPELETMPIGELLGSQRRWGRTRTRRFLSALGLNENKQLATLTHRQRMLVAGGLRERRSEPRDPVAPVLRAA